MTICFLKKHRPLHKGRRILVVSRARCLARETRILVVALARIGMTSQRTWQRRREREAMEKKLILVVYWMKKDILK